MFDRPTAYPLIRPVLLVCAFLGLEWLSEVHEHNGLPVTAWNPGLGLIFAAMLHRPMQGAMILFAGMILAEILVVHSILDVTMVTMLAATSAVCFATFAHVARGRRGLASSITRLRDIAILLGAGCAGAAVNATLLTLLLVSAGLMGWSDIGAASVPLFVGDVIGIAIVTPLVMRGLTMDLFSLLAAHRRLIVLGLGLGLWTIALPLWLILRTGDAAALGYLYVLFLPVIGAALWLGLDGACISLTFAQLTLVLMMHLGGYDAAAFTTFQAVMVVLGATGLLSGAVVTERNASGRAAADAQALLAEREAIAVRTDRFNLATGMTSTLSHEITQPMTAARSLARAAQLRLESSAPIDLPRLRQTLSGVVAQIDVAAAILSRMRNFLARGTLERRPVDITTIIADTMALMGARATRHRVKVTVLCDPKLPPVPCESVQIQQVLMNLIGNAIDAINSSDATPTVDDDRQIVIRGVGSPRMDRITISVHDTGPGIAPNLIAHVFDALTTSKPDGMGLGLSICALIVEAHGGRIWLEQSTPAGTEFRFWLPISTQGEDHAA